MFFLNLFCFDLQLLFYELRSIIFVFQEVKFKIPKNVQRAQHEREVEQAAAEKRPSPTASEIGKAIF